jgi:hypothetical protein
MSAAVLFRPTVYRGIFQADGIPYRHLPYRGIPCNTNYDTAYRDRSIPNGAPEGHKEI